MNLFSALIETIPDAVFWKDGVGRWLIINEPAKRLFQLQDLPWQGKTDLELADMHPAFRTIHETFLKDDEKAWQAGQMVVVEENMPRKNGQSTIFETRKMPVFGTNGQREGLVILARDITERKALEADLQQSLACQQQLTQFNLLLGEVNQAIARVDGESTLLQDVCALAVRHTKICLAWVGIPDDHGDFQVLAASGETDYLEGIRISTRADVPEGQGPAGQVWRNQEAIYNVEFSVDSNMTPWLERAARFGITSSSTIPIFRSGAIWAVIFFYRELGHAFNSAERNVLEDLSKDISFGLDHMDMIHQERATLAFNEVLLNNLTAGVNVRRYPDRVIELVNDRMLEIYGASSMEELVGHSTQEFYPDAESLEKVYELARTVLAQGSGVLPDVPHRRMDGASIYIDLSGQKLRTKTGEPERIVWTHVDVTERYRNEELIRKLAETQKSLLANTSTGIDMVQYPDQIIVQVNQGFLDIFGCTHEHEVLGHSTQEIYPDDESNVQITRLSQEILQNGSGSLKDLAVKRKDGRRIYVDISGQRLLVTSFVI